MDRNAAIAKLKEHETELKRLGIEHLYLFGSTARGEAREDSDVDLFFDHPVGSLGLFGLMDVKDAARPEPRAQDRYRDAAQPAPRSAGAYRGHGGTDILMLRGPRPAP
jgi:nucleotidyltransferase-like protein